MDSGFVKRAEPLPQKVKYFRANFVIPLQPVGAVGALPLLPVAGVVSLPLPPLRFVESAGRSELSPAGGRSGFAFAIFTVSSGSDRE